MKHVGILFSLLTCVCLLCGCSKLFPEQQTSAPKPANTPKPEPVSVVSAPHKEQPVSVTTQPELQAEVPWARFRGNNGSGLANGKGLPTKWSESKNLAWKTKLPGPGSSSPIVVGKRIFVAYYDGYGIDKKNPGDHKNLKRHLLCINADNGKILWDKTIRKDAPVSGYSGFMQLHGYASGTPVSDGESVFVYFGAWGITAFDMQGKKLWEADCGNRTHGFGTGASPILHGDLLIVNASVESGSMIAFNKRTGKEVWRAENVRDAWNTPVLVKSGNTTQVVIATHPAIQAYDADSGKLLWQYSGSDRKTYICPSLVTDGQTIYGMSSYHGPLVAVSANGKEVWKCDSRFGVTVPSPVYFQGHIYYPQDNGNIACIDAETGKVKKHVFHPSRKETYASPLVANGKLYVVTRTQGTLVYSATPEMPFIAHNTIAGDDSRFHGCPVPLGQRLLLRSENYLYCVGE